MTRYAALLRGINVGRAKRIAMADLREVCTGLGFRDVRTHLNSGNVVFTTNRTNGLEPLLEKAIQQEFGLDVRCLVRTYAELAAVAVTNPLLPLLDADGPSGGSRMMAHFLAGTPDPDVIEDAIRQAFAPVASAPAEVAVGERVIYQWCPDGLLQAPPIGQAVEKNLGTAVTTRNWNTVTKLVSLLELT